MSCGSHAFASVHCCLVVTCWERADLLALVGDVYCIFVTFPCGILGRVWYLIVSFPDPCLLSYFQTDDMIIRYDCAKRYHVLYMNCPKGISFLDCELCITLSHCFYLYVIFFLQ